MESDSGLFLVDAGSPGFEERIILQLQKFSEKKLRMIIITHAHFDHYGSADALRKATGAKIAISATDALYMEQGKTPIDSVASWGKLGKLFLPLAELILKPAKTGADVLLYDGDSLHGIGLPAVVHATPGHTKGSISLIVNDTIAMVSDLIVTSPELRAQYLFADSWQEIERSMKKIAALEPRVIYSGHSIKPVDCATFKGLVPHSR